MPLTRTEFATPSGRARAWRELLWADHGVLRLVYRNTHAVAPGRMFRSVQPAPADIARFARQGVRTIVNLRGDAPSGFFYLEEEACRRHGVALENFRVYSREAPTLEILNGARALFRRIEYPAVMHCKSGADRVGLMSALYLFFEAGVPFDAALGQLSLRYGHFRQGKTGVIDYALERYLDFARSTGVDLSSVDAFFAWAESPLYDPAKIKAEFLGSWWGNLLTERILRRE
ncbi:MAG: tyrosine-protein phosphatase [Parvularculaceae bacterium]|nr:tyrosine-protein phosphatase [Parvularculaceae bacterium]